MQNSSLHIVHFLINFCFTGSFTVDFLSNTLENFNEYFQSLTPQTSDNPWLLQFLEKNGDCGKSERPDTCYSAYLRKSDSNDSVHETLVMDAVYAFAHALDTMCRQNLSICSNSDFFDREKLLKLLLATSFNSLANGRISFMPNGDFAARYRIRYLQVVNGSYTYIPVGLWSDDGNNKEVITEEIPWYLEIDESTGSPRSACSLPCGLGEKQIINPDNPCCWSCFKCQPNEIVMHNDTTGHDKCEPCINVHNNKYKMPNENFTECVGIRIRRNAWAAGIITLSTFGLFFAILVTSFYIYHRNNPLVKASSRELSYVMFAGTYIGASVYAGPVAKIRCTA